MATKKASVGPQLDEWSTREKLVLACSVLRSGDQNWHSVSRTIKPICEMVVQRPGEWFSQKNCAYQYGALLDSAETPKRKRASTETGRQETPQEQILRKLTFERIEELKKSIKLDHERYKKIKKDIEKIRSGKINDQLGLIWNQLQSGKNIPIEELIPDSSGDGNNKAMLGSPPQQPSPNTAHRSRSQRVPKATERFQAFQAQLQKQQQRYQQQHQGPGTPGQTTTPATPTSLQMSPTEAIEKPPIQTTGSSGEATLVNPPLKVYLPPVASGSDETLVRQASYKSPTLSPRKVEGGASQAESESPFLSTLLTTPRNELRTVTTKQEETLSIQAVPDEKPVEKNVPSISVAKENLIVYRSISQPATPEGPVSVSAPTLSRLLEVKGTPSAPQKELTKVKVEEKTDPKDVPEKIETSKRKLLQSEEIEVDVEPPMKKRAPEEKPTPDPFPVTTTSSPSPSPPPPSFSSVQKPKVMEELTISVGDPTDVPYIPSPRGSKVKKNRGRPKKPGLIRKTQPLRLMDQGDIEETLSVDDDVSERDDTESEAASVTDKEFLEHDQDDESRSAAEDDDSKYIEDVLDAVRVPSFGKGRGKPQPLTPSSVSPSSPALSTGSSGMDPEASQAQKNWRKSIMLVWKAAASHKYANVFLHPVTDDEAPGYHTIVYRPMDLATIKKNIENGAIRSTSEFQRDMMLMFQNALMYNRADHDVYHMAGEMRDDVMEQIQYFIATQLHLMEQSNDKDARMLRGHRSDECKFICEMNYVPNVGQISEARRCRRWYFDGRLKPQCYDYVPLFSVREFFFGLICTGARGYRNLLSVISRVLLSQ